MPYKQSWLDLEQSLGGRFVLCGTPDQIRDNSAILEAKFVAQQASPSQTIRVENGCIAGTAYRLYTPGAAALPSTLLPVGIWTHGGGWIMGDLDTDDHLCREVAEQARCMIISVDYRLAPEHKMPAQLEDTLKIYRWAQQHASSFGGDITKFFTIGGSAGGALALQVANHLVSNSTTRNDVKGIAAMCPIVLHHQNVPEQHRHLYNSMQENATNVPVIDKNTVDLVYKYVQVDAHDSDIFTALAVSNHRYFPPTYLVSCQFDPLRDDATIMEDLLKKVGVPVKHDYYEGFPHYFWSHPNIPESKIYTHNLIAGVKWLIEQM